MKKLLIAICLLSLAACAQVGHKFDASRVDFLQPGVTTFQDVKAAWGEPYKVEWNNEGRMLAQWQYVVAGTFVGTKGDHVALVFGGDGKMIRVFSKSKI